MNFSFLFNALSTPPEQYRIQVIWWLFFSLILDFRLMRLVFLSLGMMLPNWRVVLLFLRLSYQIGEVFSVRVLVIYFSRYSFYRDVFTFWVSSVWGLLDLNWIFKLLIFFETILYLHHFPLPFPPSINCCYVYIFLLQRYDRVLRIKLLVHNMLIFYMYCLSQVIKNSAGDSAPFLRANQCFSAFIWFWCWRLRKPAVTCCLFVCFLKVFV